jgi:hypothetical protein
MALFYTEFLSLACANVQSEKRWWISVFGCKETSLPGDWNDPLPSDVALTLPGSDEPTIGLSDRAEVQSGGYEPQDSHPLLFSSNLKKAHEYLQAKNTAPGPIRDGGGTQFFELRDPEVNVIEICKEP